MKIISRISELNRIQYYKHYDGKRPVCCGRGDAAKFDGEMGAKVLSHLHSLGFTNFKLHDEGQGREVHDRP